MCTPIFIPMPMNSDADIIYDCRLRAEGKRACLCEFGFAKHYATRKKFVNDVEITWGGISVHRFKRMKSEDFLKLNSCLEKVPVLLFWKTLPKMIECIEDVSPFHCEVEADGKRFSCKKGNQLGWFSNPVISRLVVEYGINGPERRQELLDLSGLAYRELTKCLQEATKDSRYQYTTLSKVKDCLNKPKV